MNEKRINLSEIYSINKKVLDAYLRDAIGLTKGRLCYGIHNLKLDKWYIGSTVCGIQLRFWKCFSTGHFYQVSQGSHKFLTLENIKEFELVILEEFDDITKKELRKVESKYIVIYDSFNNGYNDTPSAQAGFYGKHHSEESRRKTSKTLIDRKNGIIRPEPEKKPRRSRPSGLKYEYSDPDIIRNAVIGRKKFYSYSAKKIFFRRPEEFDDLKSEYPDLKWGNPERRNRDKSIYPNWWDDPKWIPND